MRRSNTIGEVRREDFAGSWVGLGIQIQALPYHHSVMYRKRRNKHNVGFFIEANGIYLHVKLTGDASASVRPVAWPLPPLLFLLRLSPVTLTVPYRRCQLLPTRRTFQYDSANFLMQLSH